MALLDTSTLLTDPDFCDPLIVLRNVEVVGANGRVTLQPITIPIIGVVQAPSAATLQLLPDDANQQGAIQVHTTFALKGVTTTDAADQVQWQGQTYTVHTISDFTNYGAGFVRALCTLNPLAAPAP